MTQSLPLVEQLKNLEHLQELDLKIDSIKKVQDSLPANLTVIDETLNKLRTTVDRNGHLAAEVEKVYRQTQAALDLNRDRLTRSNTKMEAVHNSQEFQAATKEIDQLKKLNLTLEEQSKKAAIDLEGIQQQLGGLTDQLKQVQGDRDSQAETLSGQNTQFKTDIASLMAERTQYTSKVEGRILAQYDRVRGARAGLGIVPAVGGRCKGCNMMVPPQLYNEIHRCNALHSCPSCHRILYVPAVSTSHSEDPDNQK